QNDMSLRAELLRVCIRVFLKDRNPDFDLAVSRKGMRFAEKLVPRPPARCELTEIREGSLSFERVVTPLSRPERRVLYLHGGGYVSGGPAHYRHFTWRIAEALRATVFVLAYRLAPEHPFPAAIDDAARAYAYLAGQPAAELFVIGDSAGGGLTLALLLKLHDN